MRIFLGIVIRRSLFAIRTRVTSSPDIARQTTTTRRDTFAEGRDSIRDLSKYFADTRGSAPGSHVCPGHTSAQSLYSPAALRFFDDVSSAVSERWREISPPGNEVRQRDRFESLVISSARRRGGTGRGGGRRRKGGRDFRGNGRSVRRLRRYELSKKEGVPMHPHRAGD